MIITFNILFRIFTVLLFFVWWMYWRIGEKAADKQKPKRTKKGREAGKQQIRQVVLRIAEGIMMLQLIGLQLLIFPGYSFTLQFIGFTCVLLGVSIGISARKALGANWTNAHEYQVKKEHELVTTGIYSLIRHPIYTGLCVAFIGGELVAQSFLVIIGFLLLVGGYWQALLEEKLLVNHFGDSYKTYMKHTKMFIPYLW